MIFRRYKVVFLYPFIVILLTCMYVLLSDANNEKVQSVHSRIQSSLNSVKSSTSNFMAPDKETVNQEESPTKETSSESSSSEDNTIEEAVNKEILEKTKSLVSSDSVNDPSSIDEDDKGDDDILDSSETGPDKPPPPVLQQPSENSQSASEKVLEEQVQPNEIETHPESDDLMDYNVVRGTLLDNPEHRNPEPAPVPLLNKGLMTEEYIPYEQMRIVKDENYNQKNNIKVSSSSPVLANATLVALVRNEELYDMLSSIKQFEDRFNKNYHYDWVFLNDKPFTEDFIEYTSALISGTARYGIIPFEHWSYPSFIDVAKAKEVRESRKMANIAYGKSESYRHMCRYNSGFFYKHPILEEYQYYWRIEPSISYNCDILYDPFQFMTENKKKYGFTISMLEFPKTVPTLWKSSMDYFEQDAIADQIPSNSENLMSFISSDNGTTYNLCHFWSNFEIANLDIYRNKVYEDYFNHLDKAGGFFYERWGDAPVHSIAVSMMLKKEEVHIFQDIAYKHTVAGTCPHDDDLRKELRCTCNPEDDWTWISQSSCNPRFIEVSDTPTLKDHKKYMDMKLEADREKERLTLEEVEQKRKLARERSEFRRKKAEERRKKKALAAANGSSGKKLSAGSRRGRAKAKTPVQIN